MNLTGWPRASLKMSSPYEQIEWISLGVGQLIPRALGINLMGFNAKIHVSLVINLRFNSRFNSI